MTIQDLKSNNLILFEVISGSKSFGLDTPTSDTDIKGVYYLPKEQFYGLEYIPQISNETNDIVYYELGRFVELLLKNNPNILEILATPADCILYKHPIMEQLRLEDFLSKLCKDTFAGYAMTQIKKARGLNKKIVNPMEKERKSLLDFCYVLQGYKTITLPQWLHQNAYTQEQCGLINLPHSRGMYALFYDSKFTLGYKGIIKNEKSNEASLSSIPKGEKEVGYLYCNQDAYSQYCKDYKDYWDWIAKRNEERYKLNQLHGKNYDSKNMMHTVRLLQSALQIAQTGTLNIRVTNRDELLKIKTGDLDYAVLMDKAEHLLEIIEKTYNQATLMETPHYLTVEKTLIAMRKELYA
ncbi:nucleotidyltransferase domain-containing protein [Flavobacterium davisii]|uniref:Nucleotidyltransferase domain-containing protein n=1 Tax=Flavobacterium columnare TaxID=996 RepID=A0A8G0KQL5_9FLAO|nr:nucleotidyltransferase domain-containing protein [Flavobacterium davisii]QYS88286.1 nucleotidyltransferase domain-containing protein [Flavobacterium davisii]